jgi:hypothetical protein
LKLPAIVVSSTNVPIDAPLPLAIAKSIFRRAAT